MDSVIKRTLKSSRFIIVMVLLSKVLNLAKEVLIASRLGSGAETDAYFTAIVAAVLLANIIGEGISLSVIPLLSKIEAKRGKEYKSYYINNLLHITILISIGWLILNWILAPGFIKILVRGIEAHELKDMLRLVRTGLPMGLFIIIRAIFIAFLHSERSYKSGFVSWLYHYATYIVFLVYFSDYGVYGLMVTGVIASMIQLYPIIPAAIKAGYKYEMVLNFKDIYIREFFIILAPIILGTSVNMVNIVVDKSFASTLTAGSKSWLYYSDGIIQVALGIFVTGIITVIFPVFCETFSGRDTNSLKNLADIGTRLITSVILPTMIILIVFANPIVRLIFERGQFASTDTLITSRLLTYYALGLISISISLILINCHYATFDPMLPVKVAFIGIIANFTLNLILIQFMEVNGLALATSLSNTLMAILLIRDINKDSQVINAKYIRHEFVRLLPIILVMVIVMISTYKVLDLVAWTNKIGDAIQITISAIIGAFTYTKLVDKKKYKSWEFHESSNA